MVFTFDGTQYFTQLAVEPGGIVNAYDGQFVHVSLENRYLQLHVDTDKIVTGPNGTAEVDVPLANFPGVAAGRRCCSARPRASYVREGAVAGTLEPVDAAGPTNNYLVGAADMKAPT